MAQWPNLFIVGVARAGTTSLAYYLGQHPDVFMSPVKEPYFFTRYHPHWVAVPHEETAYLELFSSSGNAAYRGEATPAYFWDEESAAAIKRASPDARILISLRTPVLRAQSEYLLLRRRGYERRPSFVGVVREEMELAEDKRDDDPRNNYVFRSLYAAGVERYFETFGRERVRVVFFEEFVADPLAELGRIFDFLGVEQGPLNRIDLEVPNRGGVPRNGLVERVFYSRRARKLARSIIPPAARASVERTLMRPHGSTAAAVQALRLLEPTLELDRERLERLLDRPVPWAASERQSAESIRA